MQEEEIISLFNKGFGDKEIGQILDLTIYQVGQELKRLGLVRTKEQLLAIKRRGAAKSEAKEKKYPKDFKNYIVDDIRKGWIHSGNLDDDISISSESIQRLLNTRKRSPFDKKQPISIL